MPRARAAFVASSGDGGCQLTPVNACNTVSFVNAYEPPSRGLMPD